MAITGADRLDRARDSEFTCRSSESHPPAELTWALKDQLGNDLTHLMQVSSTYLEEKQFVRNIFFLNADLPALPPSPFPRLLAKKNI